MDKEKSINKNRIVITIAVLTAVGGLSLILHPYLLMKKEVVYDNIGFQIYNSEILNKLEGGEDDTSSSSNPSEEEKPNSEENTSNKEEQSTSDKKNSSSGSTTQKEKNNPASNYIGTLEISKIGLKKGFVSPSSKYNSIEYNVTILKGFDYPDVKNGNFILVSHSGTGPQSYFKNLYKLKVGDKAVVTYNKKKYTYKIVNIYYQKKQGYVTIYRDTSKDTLTLITCTKDNKKSQTVYIAEKM